MTKKAKSPKNKTVLLVASGDLRLSANQVCWPAQRDLERALTAAVAAEGFNVVRAHPYKTGERHGFLASQREGIEVFKRIPPEAPLIVAEAVWQYSHHVFPGLTTHRGPILTVANWSGQWPGLVGMLNLNGSLTKAGVKYSTLWSEDFTDDYFRTKLRTWLTTGRCAHKTDHVQPLARIQLSASVRRTGEKLAAQLLREKAIMGIFDEGCMGMYNAIIPDDLLHRVGVFKERLSQPRSTRNHARWTTPKPLGCALDGTAGHEIPHRPRRSHGFDRRTTALAGQDVYCRRGWPMISAAIALAFNINRIERFDARQRSGRRHAEQHGAAAGEIALWAAGVVSGPATGAFQRSG